MYTAILYKVQPRLYVNGVTLIYVLLQKESVLYKGLTCQKWKSCHPPSGLRQKANSASEIV